MIIHRPKNMSRTAQKEAKFRCWWVINDLEFNFDHVCPGYEIVHIPIPNDFYNAFPIYVTNNKTHFNWNIIKQQYYIPRI